jgi:hypothetical protein
MNNIDGPQQVVAMDELRWSTMLSHSSSLPLRLSFSRGRRWHGWERMLEEDEGAKGRERVSAMEVELRRPDNLSVGNCLRYEGYKCDTREVVRSILL